MTSALPSRPAICMRRREPGNIAVEARIWPRPPPARRRLTTAVSSTSMVARAWPLVAVQAETSTTAWSAPLPAWASHCTRSTPWMAWFISAPPPSSALVPCQPPGA